MVEIYYRTQPWFRPGQGSGMTNYERIINRSVILNDVHRYSMTQPEKLAISGTKCNPHDEFVPLGAGSEELVIQCFEYQFQSHHYLISRQRLIP